MRDLGHEAVNGHHQKLIWEDDVVPREKITAFIDSIGLDPNRVRSVMMRPDVIEVEEFIHDEDGRMQLSPRRRDEAWTHVRVIPIGS